MIVNPNAVRKRPSFGGGIYRIAEIARYTQLHQSRVRSWFRGRSDGAGHGPVFDADYCAVGKTHTASFLDMIDVLVAGQFRDLGVSMRVVRAAYAHLQGRLKTEHPFCHQELYTDGKEIIIRAADAVGDSVLSEAISHQQLFMQVLEYLERIDFSQATKLAERWRIAEGVVIDPQIGMGKPVVESTGKTTFVIANCYRANNRDAGLVAELFDVGESDVLNAFRFEQQFRRQHVA